MSDKPIKMTHAPMYAAMYQSMVPIAREHGYALAIHGSMQRDMDLLAVPWVETPSTAQQLVDAISKQFYFVSVDTGVMMLHGRMCYTLAFPGVCFVDLSVMPTRPAGGFDPNI